MFDAALAKRIRIVGFDVDGVLTANDTWLGQIGETEVEFKRFHIQDGFGFRLLRETNVEVAWVTGRKSPSTLQRAAELKVTNVLTVDAAAKVPAFESLLASRNLSWDEAAFVGDDLPDIPVLSRVALSIAVANARDEVKSVARYTTDAAGGHGAVREVIERLLKSRGEFEQACDRFFARGANA